MEHLDAWSFQSKGMDLGEDLYFHYGAEEVADYRDPAELVAALKQKQEEVLLAAQLGNALLLENRQLKEHSDKLHEQYADKLEGLEQGKHELRLKLEGCQSQWESQVSELERDVRDLRFEVERLTRALAESERDRSRDREEHSERSQRLEELLSKAMEGERSMSSQLQSLKLQLQRRGGQSRQQDEELISAMREQVLRLTKREEALEERLEGVCRENTELRSSLASLQTRLALQEQLEQRHSQQLAEAWQEAEVARGRAQQLQAQVEELEEEVSLQDSGSRRDASLLSELESSLASSEGASSKEEMKQELGSILGLLLPLTQTPSRPERPEAPDGHDDMQAMLLQLKGVAQNLAQVSSPQDMSAAFVARPNDLCGNLNAAQELRDQNALLQQENAELRSKLVSLQEQTGLIQQAIRDRDDAIAKKNLMEAELVRSKNDMMCLNNQLLEAIQRKLELSQELEAWQDDIQIVINQQLRSQQQSELPLKKTTPIGMSFFRRPSTNASTWTRQTSSSSTYSPSPLQDKCQSPWRDWLRRGKGLQSGK